MASETELLRLALAAYEAAAEPSLWRDFLKRYAETIGADAAFFQVHDLATKSSVVLSEFGMSRSLKSSYNAHYSKMNLWRERGRHL